jgi:hypothetical protein
LLINIIVELATKLYRGNEFILDSVVVEKVRNYTDK